MDSEHDSERVPVRRVAARLVCLAAAAVTSSAQQPTLQPIAGAELAQGMSRDGHVVVGRIGGPPTEQAFRWQDGALLPLGYLFGGTRSEARAASLTGAVVVGQGDSTNGFRAFRWTATGGMEDLGVLPGDSFSIASGVSDDGLTIVGGSGSNGQAFRLTPAGMTGLGTLPGGGSGGTGSGATGVSADGSVVVGASYSSFGYRPFRWTEAGMVDLGGLGALNQGFALAVSADGTAVVGYLGDDLMSVNNRAFRWTVGGGMENLGTLPGGLDSYASGVNADGTIITGRSAGGAGGFVWTPTGGMVPAASYLAARGIDTTGWTIYDVTAVSAAGTAFFGLGRSPSGQFTHWWVDGSNCVTLDFETEDDFVTPLCNGQKIDTEFGHLVRISGAGANAGLAVFDTTPGGPNDPPLNGDMLIGHGNMLLLEDDRYASETFPGYFDQVTDDPNGGDLIFDFLQPVNPLSLLLADINPPPNLGANVTLVDANGRTRVYAVEPGWTGGYGNAGPWRLDLTTTVPQPGNGTPRFATATEDTGFLQASVVQMVIHMTGFGSIDELTFCPAQASATTRNGSGRNPVILRSSTRPVLGSTWRAELDCSAYGTGLATLVMRRRAVAGRMTPFGEVLVAGAPVLCDTHMVSGTSSSFTFHVPHAMALLGMDLHVQGAFKATPAARIGKAGQMRGCLSNALDLILGF